MESQYCVPISFQLPDALRKRRRPHTAKYLKRAPYFLPYSKPNLYSLPGFGWVHFVIVRPMDVVKKLCVVYTAAISSASMRNSERGEGMYYQFTAFIFLCQAQGRHARFSIVYYFQTLLISVYYQYVLKVEISIKNYLLARCTGLKTKLCQ